MPDQNRPEMERDRDMLDEEVVGREEEEFEEGDELEEEEESEDF